jgi:HEAT repeat protein
LWEWWDGARDEIALAPAPDAPGWSTFRARVAEKIKLLGTYKFLHQKRAKETLVVVADVVREQIESALTDPDLQVRIGAADVLRGAGVRAAVPALAAALVGEENDAVATKLLAALTHCGRPRTDGTRAGTKAAREAARAAILPRLTARALGVRILAAQALGVFGTHGDTTALQSARAEARNADQAFRAMSAGSLLRLGDASAAEDLLAELACEDVARRADALGLLTAAGVSDSGYEPDAAPDLRNAAIERIRGLLASGDGVSPGGQK